MIIRRTPRFARRESPSSQCGGEGDSAGQLETFSGLHSASKAFRRVEILAWLISEYEFLPEHAEAIACRLLDSAPALRGAFLRWWVTGKIDDVEVDGYTLRDLIEEQGMHPIGALLALSLLTIEPDAARVELEKISGTEKPGGPDPYQIERIVGSRHS